MHGPKANWSEMKCFQPVTHPITTFMDALVVLTNWHAFLEAVLPSKSAFWPVITTMANSSSPEGRAVLSPPGTQSYEDVTTCRVGRLRLTEAWGPAQSHTAHWFRSWSLNTEVLRSTPFLLHFSSFNSTSCSGKNVPERFALLALAGSRGYFKGCCLHPGCETWS